MKECFYCGEEFKEMHPVERNCNSCEKNWAYACKRCYEEHMSSGKVGWDKHYSTHHYPVDIK